MAKIQKIEEVFSTDKLEILKNNVREVMKDRYGGIIDICEIAFGHMVNGISLVYIGQNQNDIQNVERLFYAQLAIDIKGQFIDIFTDGTKQRFFGYENYDENEDITFLRFRISRLYNIISSNNVISTDDFIDWEMSSDKSIVSEYLVCDYQTYDGKVKPCIDDIVSINEEDDDFDDYLWEEDDDEEDNPIDYDNIKENTYLCKCWGWNKQTFDYKKLKTDHYSRYIIKENYLLLIDNLRSYSSDEYFCDLNYFASSYKAMFKKYKIDTDDLFDNRYGIYDISQNKIIIHVGEMQIGCALISGFRKIEFNFSSILTYDFLDILAHKGMPYSKQLSGIEHPNIISSSCLPSRNVWIKAQNNVTDFWGLPESRSGLNAGEWYIIREGEHAGRTLCWLLANGYIKDILKMINIGYISFSNFNHFTYPTKLKEKERNAIWLALDKQKMFNNIESINDHLELDYPFNKDWIAKHDAIALDSWGESSPCFEELVYEDTDYIVGLILKRSLYVKQNVMDELRDCYEGNKKYLSKLKKVQNALDEYNEDIEVYNEMIESQYD